MALWLSLAVPGLGHLYKGHVVVGGVIFFLVGPVILTLSLAAASHTLGASLIVPLVFLAAVMLHAYRAKDRRLEVIRKAREMDSGQALR
jgi:hypothetical protein